MGANFDYYTTEDMEFKDLQLRHELIREQQRAEYGYDPYSGTWAAKAGGLILQTIHHWTLEDAEEHCMDNNNKWDSAFAYKLDDERWFVGGWRPE